MDVEDEIYSAVFLLGMDISRQDWEEASRKLNKLLNLLGVKDKLPTPSQEQTSEPQSDDTDDYLSDGYESDEY